MASDGSPAEVARYWQHSSVAGVDLLRARFVTHRYGKHAHETYTLAVIERGIEEFEHRGTLERAGPGAVVLVNPEVVHTGQAGIPDGWTYRVFYPEVQVLADIAADLGWPRPPSFPQAVIADPGSAGLLRAAHIAAEHGDQLASSTLLRTALGGMLAAHGVPARASGPGPARLGRAGSGRGGSGRGGSGRAVEQVRELLNSRLADPPSLDELAVVTGLSPFALVRAFRAETGLPPHAYLNQVRVRRARRLLDRGLAPAEVAAHTGFADQAHLTRHFKRVVGVPPGAYQRERLPAPAGAAQLLARTYKTA